MEQACDEAEAEKLKILKEREELQLQNSAENENSNEINPQDLVQDILNDVVNHVVDVCSVTKPSRNLTRELYANIMQKDCFLVFRSLCKLSKYTYEIFQLFVYIFNYLNNIIKGENDCSFKAVITELCRLIYTYSEYFDAHWYNWYKKVQ